MVFSSKAVTKNEMFKKLKLNPCYSKDVQLCLLCPTVTPCLSFLFHIVFFPSGGYKLIGRATVLQKSDIVDHE